MAYNAEYAVRIAKVNMSTRKKSDCIYITFGPKAHVKDEYNAVEVTIFPGKLSFRFFTTEKKKFGPYTSKGELPNSKKTKITILNSLKRVAIYDEDFIKKLEGFEGEYQDASVNPARSLTYTDDYICWVNLVNKESYTNMYKNTSTEYSHKKPEPKIETDIPAEKPKVTTEVIKQVIDKQYEDIAANPDPEKTIVPIRVEELERALCEDVLKEAHECTRRMQEKISNLLEYRLKRRDLDPGEADGNLDFCKVITKYARLEYGVGDLIRNIRHTWSDGRDLYERYEELLKEEPDISDEEAAKKLDVKIEEFQETIEAVERILEDTKDSFKLGFAIE